MSSRRGGNAAGGSGGAGGTGPGLTADTPADPMAALAAGLSALGIAATGAQSETLAAYYRELLFWNEKYGLVNARGSELVVKHFLDSLAALAEIRALLGAAAARRTRVPPSGPGGAARVFPGEAPADEDSAIAPCGTIADAGSGAGLPGIPLAIMLPGTRVTLIERSGRRCRFLENVVVMLQLKNVTIQEKGIENADGRFDVVTFRAFRPLEPDIFRALVALRASGGSLAAYKGRAGAVAAELAALRTAAPALLAGEAPEVRPLSVPFLAEERNLLVMRGGWT